MQMIQDTGLMFGDGFPSFVLAHVLTMAGEKDGRVGIQQTSDSRVQHTRQTAAKGLICQTKNVLCKLGSGTLDASSDGRRVMSSRRRDSRASSPYLLPSTGTEPYLAGQGAPAACHCFTFAENSSCGMGTGVRPSPGFQPHITSLSSVKCSTS